MFAPKTHNGETRNKHITPANRTRNHNPHPRGKRQYQEVGILTVTTKQSNHTQNYKFPPNEMQAN
jgi:hypothetical protein